MKDKRLKTTVCAMLLFLTLAGVHVCLAGADAARDIKRVPLLIQSVFIPFAHEETNEKVTARLDEVTEFDPGDDVAATLIGANLAGLSCGYDFTPIQVIKKGEKARDIIGKIPTHSELVLLVRVSTRTADFGGARPIILVMADAALYRRSALAPLLNAAILSSEDIEQKEITAQGDKVHGEYWMKTVATTFARSFDQKVLARMQNLLSKNQIMDEIKQLKTVPATNVLTPAVTPLIRKGERPSELNIGVGATGTNGFAYLEPSSGTICRRWVLSSSQDADVHVDPGRYTLYVEMRQQGAGGDSRRFRTDLNVEKNRRYSFNIK